MKKKFYLAAALIVSLPVFGVVVNGLLSFVGGRLDWSWPIAILLTAFFWREYFNIKYNQRGLWQIVSPSNWDKLSLILHLVIWLLLTAWVNQMDVNIYSLLVWFGSIYVSCLSFFVSSTKEAKPLLKEYFSDM